MTLYEVLLFVHILAVAVWVGGSIMLGLISARIQRTGDAAFRARFARAAGVVGPAIGISAALILASGAWMVVDSETIELSQLWVWLGLALFLLSAIAGAAYFAPASDRIVKALEAGQVQGGGRGGPALSPLSRLDTLLLRVVVGLMVFKPGA